MKLYRSSVIKLVFVLTIQLALAGRHPTHRYYGPIPAASQQVPQIVGYHYPVPAASTNVDSKVASKPDETLINKRAPASPSPSTTTSSSTPLAITAPTTTATTTTTTVKPKVQSIPAVLVKKSEPIVVVAQASAPTANVNPGLEAAAAQEGEGARLLQAHHNAQVQTIDVACGKEKMTVRVTFDQDFNGVIYAKGHYSDPSCRFTTPNQGQKVFQFEMLVGQCGVSFVDSGLTTGGQAYVEGMLVIILEPGVQEAWDAARRIRCLWEGNIDQTVTFPLSINMLESQTLTFSGDTASASLEIQSGRGPRAPSVQGLVPVGELLTAVVSVQGDPDFDLLVRNCVATDGTPSNKIILSDNRGCAVKPKLMGGWQKQRNPGTIAAYAYLSAFKFPDVTDLFLECTVSLCKGACEECPEYLELHIPSHDHSEEPQTASFTPQPSKRNVRTSVKVHKRSVDELFNDRYNETVSAESLRLRRVVHVVGPDDLPELAFQGPTLYGNGCPNDCFSLLGIIAAVAVTFCLMLISLVVFGVFRRHQRNDKF